MKGLTKGHNIPTIGQVAITWLSNTPKNTTPSVSTAPSSVPDEVAGGPRGERSRTPEIDPIQSREDEVVASGWGGHGDDGDGMGML
jgi:RNA-binding protein 26